LNNNDLAETIAAANGLTKADARKLVDGVLAAVVKLTFAPAKAVKDKLNG